MYGGKNESWLTEYKSFLECNEEVPASLNSKVSARINPLLNPKAFHVFTKLLMFHGIIGFLSLSVCHQFGVNPFRTPSSIADWLMSVGGHSICMIGCGLLFLGSSILASGYFLSLEESRALRRTGFPQSFALGALSLAIFAALGAELALTFAGLWLLGALIGAFVATELVWWLKVSRS